MAEQQLSAPPRARQADRRAGVTHIRHRHTERFTVVGNHLAQHRELSLVAIGLALHIQSRPDGAAIGVKALAARFPEGEITLARALRELEAHGYLERVRERTTAGWWVTRTYAYDHPERTTAEPAPEPDPVSARTPAPAPARAPAPAPARVRPTREHRAAGAVARPCSRPAATEPQRLPPTPPTPATRSPRPDPQGPRRSPGQTVARPRQPGPAAAYGTAYGTGYGTAYDPAHDVTAGTTADTTGEAPHSAPSDPATPHPAAVPVLAALHGRDPRLLLSERDVRRLAPALSVWLERGVTPQAALEALSGALPAGRLAYPAGLIGYRLRELLPPAPPGPGEPAGTTGPPRSRPLPFQTCPDCDRAFRSAAPGRCRDCTTEAESEATGCRPFPGTPDAATRPVA